MKAKTKSTKEVLLFVALALGLVLLAGLSGHGARPAAARPASQDEPSTGTPTMTITETPTMTITETPTMTITTPPTMTFTPTPTMTFTPTPTPEMPVLTIDKRSEMVYDADGDNKPDPGDKLRYKITYENTSRVDATDVIIIDDYDEGMVVRDKISDNGKDNGDYIEWDLDKLSPGEKKQVTFEVTIKAEISPGSYELKNYAFVTSMELFEWEETVFSDNVVVHTPTPTPMDTPAPTLAPPTPAPSGPQSGPQSGIFAAQYGWALAIIVSLLSVVAIAALLFAPFLMKKSFDNDDAAKTESMEALRHGVFVIFIIFAILILALGGGVKEDGAISILSAIVGYLFGRATGKN